MLIIYFTSYLLKNTSKNYVQNLSNTMVGLSTSKEHYKNKNKESTFSKFSTCSEKDNHYWISTEILMTKVHSANIWNVNKLSKKKNINCMIKLGNFWKKKLNSFNQSETHFSDMKHTCKKSIHLTMDCLQKFAIWFKWKIS